MTLQFLKFSPVLLIGLVPFGYWLYADLYEIWDARNHKAEIMQATKVYDDCEGAGLTQGNVIGEISPGDQIDLERICISKNFRVLKIKRTDGLSGWVVDGDGTELR
jgi:hypothetical protein